MPFLALLLDACAPSVSGVDPGDSAGTTGGLFIVDNSSSMNGRNDTFAEAVESAVTSWLSFRITG
ncbi:MAG: hypothetical protein Q8P18_26410 [Pseudomonadota bacterium]|nr:hypothetical protein [Pseudomonadota bacterium]